VISNSYIHSSPNQIAFVYYKPSEHPTMPDTYVVVTTLKWVTANFYASTMEQALDVCDSLEILANYGMEIN